MALDLRHVLRLARQWWWLLLICPLIAGSMAYLLESRRATDPIPRYTTSTTILINPDRNGNTPTFSASTYGRLLLTNDVLTPVIQTLKLPFGVQTLRGMVSAVPVADSTQRSGTTELLQVFVTDVDPQRAAAIANEVAASFASYITEQAVAFSEPYREALAQQIDDTKRQIDDVGQQIQALQEGPDADDPAVSVQLGTLQAQLSDLQQSYAQLLLTAQTMDLNAATAQSRMTIVDEAEVPLVANPVPSSIPKAPLAAVAGLAFAVALVLLIEYFDNTIKRYTDIPTLTGSSVLGAIPRVRKLDQGRRQLFMKNRSGASAAEAIRLLRTNLDFLRETRGVSVIAVTSPGSGDGKSTVASNLAVSIAQTGLRTILLDADLRQPSMHRIFGIRNSIGLASLLTDIHRSWQLSAAGTPETPNLRIIPSGQLLGNPADLLTSARFVDLLTAMREQADVIIVDTPPLLEVSDALIVASDVDGVLVVCRAGHTSIDGLQSTVGLLRQGADKLLGIVVNGQADVVGSAGSYARPRAPVQAQELSAGERDAGRIPFHGQQAVKGQSD